MKENLEMNLKMQHLNTVDRKEMFPLYTRGKVVFDFRYIYIVIATPAYYRNVYQSRM